MDWYVLLTPLFALAVIALLGFTGCQKLFGLDEVSLPPPPPPTTMLTFEARFPSNLALIHARFEWTAPGAMSGEYGETPQPLVTTDGTDTVVSHVISTTAGGTWMMVNCSLRVQDTIEKGSSTSMDATFVLDPQVDPTVTARFSTMGRPDTKDFRVIFVGRVP